MSIMIALVAVGGGLLVLLILTIWLLLKMDKILSLDEEFKREHDECRAARSLE